MSASVAPDRMQLRLHLHNIWRNWRVAPAEHLFHLLAGLALLAVIVLAALPSLRRVMQYTPDAMQIGGTALLVLLGLLLLSRRDARHVQLQLNSGWLAASAWPLLARRQALRRAVLYRCALRILLLWTLLLAVLLLREPPAPPWFWTSLCVLSILAPLTALPWTWPARSATPADAPRRVAAIAPVPASCRGLALLQHAWRAPPLQSQRIQAGLALALVPGELAGSTALAVLFLLLALLWAGRCYRHFRDSCFAATQWLAASVLPARRLAGALLPPLIWRLLLVGVLAAVSMHAAGAPALWLLAGVAVLLALLALNIALVLVHRQQARQYRLASTTQTLLLILLLQSLPPAAALLWCGLAWRAWRAITTPAKVQS